MGVGAATIDGKHSPGVLQSLEAQADIPCGFRRDVAPNTHFGESYVPDLLSYAVLILCCREPLN